MPSKKKSKQKSKNKPPTNDVDSILDSLAAETKSKPKPSVMVVDTSKFLKPDERPNENPQYLDQEFNPSETKILTKHHKFWDSQPQMKLEVGSYQFTVKSALEAAASQQKSSAPPQTSQVPPSTSTTQSSDSEENNPQTIVSHAIEANKTPDQVRKTPLKLVGFEWDELDIKNPDIVDELYDFLRFNYVEDSDHRFRFEYPKPFLLWALKPPGWRRDWHVGIRNPKDGSLIGFISAIPTRLTVPPNKKVKVVEINFLCVHKTLRTARLAPVMIMEITRRVHLQDIFQAVYTAGILIPTPIASSRYWHRSLNPSKLLKLDFSFKKPDVPQSLLEMYFKLPKKPLIPGFREMVPEDVPQVHKILKSWQEQFKVWPDWTEDETAYWLTPRKGIIHTYVVELYDQGEKTSPYLKIQPTSGKKVIVDMVSFYILPTLALRHGENINGAYLFYLTAHKTFLEDIVGDALVKARHEANCDVMNALNIMGNTKLFDLLRFAKGDGKLHYYLYNWLISGLSPKDIGLVMM